MRGFQATGKPRLFKPKNIREYEGLEHEDLTRLYKSKDPYSARGLGFSPQTLRAQYAYGRNLTRGAETRERQRSSDRWRSSGSVGRGTVQHQRSQERRDIAATNRANMQSTQIMLANEVQRRSDLFARLSAVGGAFARNVEMYNKAKGAEYAHSKWRNAGMYEAGGKAVDDFAGMMAGMGGGGVPGG
jgi:hypothetical protein